MHKDAYLQPCECEGVSSVFPGHCWLSPFELRQRSVGMFARPTGCTPAPPAPGLLKGLQTPAAVALGQTTSPVIRTPSDLRWKRPGWIRLQRHIRLKLIMTPWLYSTESTSFHLAFAKYHSSLVTNTFILSLLNLPTVFNYESLSWHWT